MAQDVIDSIGAVRREVRTCERNGAPARAVVAGRTFDTTVDDVWDALTNPDRIPRWFLPIEGELKLGGRYQLVGNAGGEVTACEPPTHLAVTWEMGGGVSWVDVYLEEAAGGGAGLRLEHVALVEDLEMWDQFGPGAVGVGWDLAVLGLAEHLRTGEDVAKDPEQALHGAGPEVMARSSELWGEAEMAWGTPEADARARAEATAAFYTGGPEGGAEGDDPGAGTADGGAAGAGEGEPAG